MNGSPQHNSYTAADIQRYHAGEMTAQERHALEKAALDDPFLADALEGYVHTKTAQSDLALINSRLKNKTKKEEAVVVPMPVQRFPWMRVAALFVLIAGGAWLAYRFTFQPQKEIATTQKAKKENQTVQAPASPATASPTVIDTMIHLADSGSDAPLPQDNTEVVTKPVDKLKPNAIILNDEAASDLALQRAERDSIANSVAANATVASVPSAANHVYAGRQRTDDSAALNEVVVTRKSKDSLQLDVKMTASAVAMVAQKPASNTSLVSMF